MKKTLLRAGLLPLSLAMLLAGCQKQAAEKGAAKAAGGEVLPGTVSDAMINLDGATGTPPLQPAPRAKPTAKAPEAQASEEPASGPVADPAPAPAPARSVQ